MELVHELLEYKVSLMPNKKAIVSRFGFLTYKELYLEVLKMAGWFIEQGVKKGDRVILVLPNCMPIVSMIFALSRLGVLFAIINYEVKGFHLDYIINDSEPVLVITDKKHPHLSDRFDSKVKFIEDILCDKNTYKETASSIKKSIHASDFFCLFYTSGSTGYPKAVITSHSNVMFSLDAISKCLEVEQNDIIGNFLPLSFDYGLYQVFLAIKNGATFALFDGRQSGPELLSNIIEYKVTGLPIVPNLALGLIKLLKRKSEKFDQLRFITNTGEKLPVSYIREIQNLMPDCKIFLMYGLTECKRVSILESSKVNEKIQSVGRPLPGTECWIVDKNDNILPRGMIGELVVKGPHVTQGYWRNTFLTQKKFRVNPKFGGRVLYTGDLCSMDAEGYIYFHGRRDDVFKIHGYRVSKVEIENAALDIPEVEQAVIILDRSHDNLSSKHILLLLKVDNDQLTVDQIKSELAKRLEKHKIPSMIRVVDTFPLLPNGKINIKELEISFKSLISS